jgi:hypothetical protein
MLCLLPCFAPTGMLLRKIWELNTHQACENIRYFVNKKKKACFSRAQNAENGPIRICVPNSLNFNYNLLTNQE